MNILVIGSGGREHCICRQFLQSKKVTKVFCINGNSAMTDPIEIVDIEISDFLSIANFAKENDIAFTFVGPEIPLAQGIVDFFRQEKLKIVGPSKAASRLESSKNYAKQIMQKYKIPMPAYHCFEAFDDALNFLYSWEENKKIVVKADGLAAGKGVYMCAGRRDAIDAVSQIMKDKVLGKAGEKIIIEEYIDGVELSYLVFTDGKHYSMMPASQDHKRINDNDQGANTGGMGAYCPAPLATEKLNNLVENTIVKKTIAALVGEKLDYKGIIYIGVILSGDKPLVLEYNCRLGDPETQAVIPLLETDLVDICLAILSGKLDEIKIRWKKEFAVSVVLASAGYPANFEKGFEIKGLAKVSNAIIFYAGTAKKNGKFVTAGGRVLAVTAIDKDIKTAVDKVYEQVKKISFDGMHYRKDIAKRALK
jgi:phosphoribosylamine--glycine ligase